MAVVVAEPVVLRAGMAVGTLGLWKLKWFEL